MNKGESDNRELNILKWIEKNSIENFRLETDLYLRDLYTKIIQVYNNQEYSLDKRGTINRVSYNNPVIIEILLYL
jgi:hypothetical protein